MKEIESDRNSDEGKHTIAVIMGHLTLRRDMISRYDYTCVEYPCGIENGLFYVNQEDIIEVIHRTPTMTICIWTGWKSNMRNIWLITGITILTAGRI